MRESSDIVTLGTMHETRQSRHPKAMGAAIAGILAISLWFAALPASAAPGSNPPGDPPGNNGTIKVVADGNSDADPGNEPQIDGCLVWLEFYGFDTDQQSVITFREIPPTGEGQVLLTQTAEISDDPAGGGQDKDATLSYNLSAALGSLTTSDPEKGYHIKVTSDTIGAPGGAKKKVFWIRCATAPASALRVTKAVEGAGTGPFAFNLVCNHSPLDRTFVLGADGVFEVSGVPSGTTCVVTETGNGGALSTRISETPPDGNDDGTFKITTGTISNVVFTNTFPAALAADVASAEANRGGAAATVAATTPGAQVGAVRVERLPETGLATNVALAAGVGLILVGGLLVNRTKRRFTW